MRCDRKIGPFFAGPSAAAAKKNCPHPQRKNCLKLFALYHVTAIAPRRRLPFDAAASHSRCVLRPCVSLLLPRSRRLRLHRLRRRGAGAHHHPRARWQDRAHRVSDPSTLVPHRKTGELALGLLRNDLDLIVHTYAAVAPAIKDGSVRAIAGTAANRSAVLPTVPTLKESGLPGFEAASWNGIFARAGTPRRIVDRLNREINAVLSQDHVRKRLLDIGIEPLAGTPEEFTRGCGTISSGGGLSSKKPGSSANSRCGGSRPVPKHGWARRRTVSTIAGARVPLPSSARCAPLA